MTFIYSTEKRIFEREWEKTEALCREHGMSEEAIQALREYDLERFNAARNEALHTQEMGFQIDEDEDAMMESPLLIKFPDRFSSQYDTHGNHSRYWWLEELGDPRLAAGVLKMSEDDKELLTLYFIEQYSTREIATCCGISHVAVYRHLQRAFSYFAETDSVKINKR